MTNHRENLQKALEEARAKWQQVCFKLSYHHCFVRMKNLFQEHKIIFKYSEFSFNENLPQRPKFISVKEIPVLYNNVKKFGIGAISFVLFHSLCAGPSVSLILCRSQVFNTPKFANFRNMKRYCPRKIAIERC